MIEKQLKEKEKLKEQYREKCKFLKKLKKTDEDYFITLSEMEDLELKINSIEVTEKQINVTFTAEIQGDGRMQLPGTIRRKLDLNRGDVLEITINKKL
jgi:hypothetical protein